MHTQTLGLTKKAFQLRKVKIETLKYAFEQIKPILRKYMREKGILELELDLKSKKVLVLEPILSGERDLWVRLWLNGEVPTEKLVDRMRERFQWVEYLDFSDFLSGVEIWVKEMR